MPPNTNPQYFEGILQLRRPSEEAVAAIEQAFAKRPGVHIAKIVETKHGLDFYVSSNAFLRKLGKDLQKQFGGTMKVSASLHTKSHLTSKELHRVTVLVELPAYAKGDVVVADGKLIKVTSIDKQLHGINLNTGKKVRAALDAVTEQLQKHKVTISKVQPQVEVLDPESYQPIAVANTTEKELKQGHTTRVVVYQGRAYLV